MMTDRLPIADLEKHRAKTVWVQTRRLAGADMVAAGKSDGFSLLRLERNGTLGLALEPLSAKLPFGEKPMKIAL